MGKCKFTPLILTMAALPFLMAADVYRWVDANGVVNYTQQKPAGINAVLISSTGRVRSSNPPPAAMVEPIPAPGAAAPELTSEQQKMLDDLKTAEAERLVAYEAAKKDNCERSRRVLEYLSANGRVRVRADDGSQKVLPEDERQQRIADAQRGVAENC